MIKTLKSLLIFLVIVSTICYFLSAFFMTYMTRTFLQQLIPICAANGVNLNTLAFKFAAPTSYNAVSWLNISTGGEVVRPHELADNITFRGTVGTITVTIAGLEPPSLIFEANGINLSAAGKIRKSTSSTWRTESGNLENGYFRAGIALGSRDPSALLTALQTIVSEVRRFATNGRTDMPMEFSGTVSFAYKGKPMKARVGVRRVGTGYSAYMDDKDISDICATLGIRLADAEIGVLADNPLRVPDIMLMTKHAEESAVEVHKNNPAVPEDAYRHILWSYLLTLTYGEEFAKSVTDAHETQPDARESAYKGSIPFDAMTRQDLANSAVGRRYARMGYAESSIAELMLNDPDVILYAH